MAAPEPQSQSQSQLGFPDRVYLLASVIFQNHHLVKPAAHQVVTYGKERGLPLPEVNDEVMQLEAYELAFSTLKYQELLEGIMTDSGLYRTHPVPDDQMGLVAVMLCDFQDRKFLPRKRQREEEIIPEVRDVENYLLRFKTKLEASLARYRVEHHFLSVECFLPESVKKKQERSSSLPLYTWVNTLKSSLDEVQSVLKSSGFSRVKSIGQLEGRTFYQDPHCGDVLVFPAQLKSQLHSTKLLTDHKLIIQDKSCSLGPNAARSLIPEEGDVLMVGCFSGLTVSHTACLIAEKHNANINNQRTVYVCVSDCTDAQRDKLQLIVSAMGCKNVKLMPEAFQCLDGGDKRLRMVRVILLTPKCSLTAVSNPVEFILQENGDPDLLQDLSQGSIAQSKLESLVAQQRKDIDHALKFPKVLVVVYSTCSSHPEENVDVVNKALLQTTAHSDQAGKSKQANFRLGPSPFSPCDFEEGTEETDPFFMLEASEHSNGCFLAVLSREPDPVVKEAPEDVIARANAKGILDRIGSNHRSRKEHHGHTKRMKKAPHSRTSQPRRSGRNQSKHHQAKGSRSDILCGHQEFANAQQSSQGKPEALPPQALKTTESSSSSSFSKQENSITTKSVTPVSNTADSIAAALHLAFSPAAPRAPVVRSRRAHQEVLRLPVLNLPSDDFPPQDSGTGFSPGLSYNKWKTPTQIASLSRSSDGLPKDATDRSRRLFLLPKQ